MSVQARLPWIGLALWTAMTLAGMALSLAHGEIGDAAVDTLVELLAGGAPGSQVLGSEPALVVRASTAPPP